MPKKKSSKSVKKVTAPKQIASAEYLLREKRYRDFIASTEGNRPRVDDPRASQKTRVSIED